MKKPTLPPAKMEMINKDPLVLKIHEYSTPKMQNLLKEFAFKNLKLSEYPPRLAMVANLRPTELVNKKQFSQIRKVFAESKSIRIYSMIPGGHYGPVLAEVRPIIRFSSIHDTFAANYDVFRRTMFIPEMGSPRS